MKDRLPGLYWVGSFGFDGLAYSEAFYKLIRIQDLVNVLNSVGDDLEKTASILNLDCEPDDPWRITPEEISRVVEFASNNQTKVVREP